MRGRSGRRRGIAAGWLAAAVIAMSATARAQVPGPELFAREPRTPIELWEAIDYLVRTGQAPKAVPYLDRFQKLQPDDATMVAVRDRFGVGSFMRLDDHPATKPFARPLADRLAGAAHRYATRPDRMRQLIDELLRSPEEQAYALRRLWEAGPYAVPPLIEALRRPGLSPEQHDRLVQSLGRLQPSALPPLAAALESTDPAQAADAATALGSLGDARAVPFLTFPAAWPSTSPVLRSAAQAAIARLTGRPFDQQPTPPIRVLADAAWAYHRARSEGPEEPVVLWSWDDARKLPVPREVTPVEARTTLGLHFARQALQLDPNDRQAQVAQLSLALERAAGRVGPDAVAAKEPDTFAAATAAGPAMLAMVLETAIADRKPDLEAAAVLALAKVTAPAALVATGRPHPLVRALTAPGRRGQFAAARAIVELAPDRPFPGSSLVAKTLGRFLVNRSRPRAVVIDENPSRAAMVGSALMGLGYEVEAEGDGAAGFLAAAESADVELILVAYDLHRGWALTDTLANLQADARTAAAPLFVYGPHDLRYTRPNLEHDFPGMRWLVPSPEPVVIERQIGGRPSKLTEAERLGYAREAAALLARIAAAPRGPMAAGLRAIEPELVVALNSPETARSAVAALADLPDPDAQRALFDAAMDPSRPPDFRADAARRLAAGIGRFGPLITRDQEARLAHERDDETDPAVRDALAALVEALRSRRAATSIAPARTPTRPGAPR